MPYTPEDYARPGTPDKLPVINHRLFSSAIEAWGNNSLAPRTREDESRKRNLFDQVPPSEVDDLGQLWRDADVNMATPGAIIASAHESSDPLPYNAPGLNNQLMHRLMSENAPHSLLERTLPKSAVGYSDHAILMHVEDDEGNRQVMAVDPEAHMQDKDFPIYQPLESYRSRLEGQGQWVQDPTYDDESATVRHERGEVFKQHGAEALKEHDTIMRDGYVASPNIGRTAQFNAGRRRRELD